MITKKDKIMKNYWLILLFIVFSLPLVLVSAGEQEEIDFLLFMPNSSEEFMNAGQAKTQLDNIAKFLLDKSPVPGQISVYGYAAVVNNDIDAVDLSKNRALHVINELQKRGLWPDLFSEPVAFGAVDLWGGNVNENDRIPNRRVRILLDGEIITPVIVQAVQPVQPEIKAPEPFRAELPAESGIKFPWKLILLLLLLALLAALAWLLTKNKKKPASSPVAVAKQAPVTPVPVKPVAQPVPAQAPPVSPPVTPVTPLVEKKPESVYKPVGIPPKTAEKVLNLEEEIRFRAYELNLERGGQNGDMDGDWYRALPEVCARYEAEGYKVYAEDGSWWARK